MILWCLSDDGNSPENRNTFNHKWDLEGQENCKSIVTEASVKDTMCKQKGWTRIRVSRPTVAEGKDRIEWYRSRLFGSFAGTKLSSFLLIASIFLKDREA